MDLIKPLKPNGETSGRQLEDSVQVELNPEAEVMKSDDDTLTVKSFTYR